MPTELSDRLRGLVEQVPSVSADEARHRAERQRSISTVNAGAKKLVLAVGAVVIAMALLLVGLSPWSNSKRAILEASVDALSSGTADAMVIETLDGAVADRWNIDMAFSGANLTETVTWTNYPVSASGEAPPVSIPPSTSTNGMALVNGEIYRQLNDQWYVESESAAPNLVAVPTPRTLVSNLTTQADVVSLGAAETPVGTLMHLEAKNPSAIAAIPLLGGAGESVTQFDVWVDQENVVRRLTATTSGESATCIGPSPTAMSCTRASESETLEMTFSNLGVPQSIQAPSGALPGSGPSDGPTN
jgi:hypothetical protein